MYIHGTNSFALALLPLTDFQFLSPLVMIKRLQLAPLGGEIVKGGYAGLDASGETAFARLDSNLSVNYHLYSVIDHYSVHPSSYSPEEQVRLLQKEIEDAPRLLFSNLHKINIYLGRLKETGVDTSEVLNPEILKTLDKQFAESKKIFNFLSLLGFHIICSKKADQRYLTLNELASILKDADVERLLDNPTPEKLERVIAALQPFGDFRYGKAEPEPNPNSRRAERCELKTFQHYTDSSRSVESLLSFLVAQKNPTNLEFFDELQMRLGAHLPLMDDVYSQFKTMVTKLSQNVITDNSLLADPFPVMLICHETDKMYQYQVQTGEYRATAPLTVGQEITCLATDTVEHEKRLRVFLDVNGKSNVKTTTFAVAKQEYCKPILQTLCDELDNSFIGTNSSGLVKFQKILDTKLSPEDKVQQIIGIARSKSVSKDWYSHSHVFGKGRHAAVDELYKKLSTITADFNTTQGAKQLVSGLKLLQQFMKTTNEFTYTRFHLFPVKYNNLEGDKAKQSILKELSAKIKKCSSVDELSKLETTFSESEEHKILSKKQGLYTPNSKTKSLVLVEKMFQKAKERMDTGFTPNQAT